MRGRLIIFEGLDGTGKTTQIELLSKHLQEKGLPVIITRWNSSRLVSKAIKRAKKARLLTPYLYSTLHATDFHYRLENIIIPSLYEGYYVIADRYVYTALARDIARRVDRAWVEHLYALAPKPDLAFYCKTSLEESLERVIEKRSGGIPSYYEAGMDVVPHADPLDAFRAFQSRVASEYEWICRQYQLLEIDTTRRIDEVFDFVRQRVDGCIAAWHDEENQSDTVGQSSPVPHAAEITARPRMNLAAHSYPGKLIVIESVDKLATARQANILYNELLVRGCDVEIALTGDSWVGTEVERKALSKSILTLSAKVLLSTSEIALMFEQKIVPTLSRGGLLILDGYMANLVSRFCAAGLYPEWFDAVYRVFPIKPDLTIFLDAPLHELMRRRSPFHTEKIFSGNIFGQSKSVWDETPDLSVLQKMVGLYREFARMEGWRTIPLRGTPNEVHKQVLEILPPDFFAKEVQPSERLALREVFRLLGQYDQEFDHPRKVAELALSIFDQLLPLHGFGVRERDALYYSAILHDIGHALSDKNHDEYTYEAIIRYAFTAISKTEQELIANIAYLHRVPYGKINVERLARLRATDQVIVKKMASLLRLADALDESGRGVVHNVRCYEEGGVLFIDLHAVSKARQEREAVLRKADMFEQVYQKPVVVERNLIEKRSRRAVASRQSHGEQV
jgi:dTMP kinase